MLSLPVSTTISSDVSMNLVACLSALKYIKPFGGGQYSFCNLTVYRRRALTTQEDKLGRFALPLWNAKISNITRLGCVLSEND